MISFSTWMSSIFLLLWLASTCITKPNNKIHGDITNFSIENNNNAIEPLNQVVEMSTGARSARQVDPSSYTDSIDDLFIEEAVYLTPEDRERDQRALEEGDDDTSSLNFDNFEFNDESLIEEEINRPERDGGAHGFHGSHGSPSPRNNRRFQQAVQSQETNFRQSQSQDQRGSRQTGQRGNAIDVQNNPPSSRGDYNFNFSNDDGSSRQESGAPDGIRGSYSFITPEGEQVNVQYIADETGFHATGSHVPQAPPMPAHVQRLLDHLAKVNGLPRL